MQVDALLKKLLGASLVLCSMQIGAQESEQYAAATFAGGCFWCMEHPFDELEGVISTTSGYAGGHKQDPSYEQVTTGTWCITEVVQVL